MSTPLPPTIPGVAEQSSKATMAVVFGVLGIVCCGLLAPGLGGGFLLARDGMEVNCSFPAALEAQRPELEAEVASMLF